ncbi:MAG: hypothetical protein WCS72_07660 [Deltaproteobacteria bacterium]
MAPRPLPLAALSLLLLLPGTALARSWQGITPGQSTQADVVTRFGEPSTRGKLEGRTALVYKAEQAIAGTRQAQFLVGEDGRVAEINVFPGAQLEKDAVLGTFGRDPQKTFTDDFRTVWLYKAIGVVVFFGKDGLVEAIRFQAATTATANPSPAASTSAPAAAPAPAAPSPTPGH